MRKNQNVRSAERKRYDEEYYKRNSQKMKDKMKDFYQKRPEYKREYAWKKYGIVNPDGSRFTIKNYRKLYRKQKGRCGNKICGLKLRTFYVDHDHQTGVVRGLLCFNCNLGLGKFKDNK